MTKNIVSEGSNFGDFSGGCKITGISLSLRHLHSDCQDFLLVVNGKKQASPGNT